VTPMPAEGLEYYSAITNLQIHRYSLQRCLLLMLVSTTLHC